MSERAVEPLTIYLSVCRSLVDLLRGCDARDSEHEVDRFLPRPDDSKGRVETGVVQFGEDWPGTFVRGDMSMYYAMNLASVCDRLAALDSSEDAANTDARDASDGQDRAEARVRDLEAALREIVKWGKPSPGAWSGMNAYNIARKALEGAEDG